MNRRKRIILFAAALVLLLSAAAVYAAVQKGEVSVKNQFKTGSIDLDLTAYEQTGNGEREAKQGKAVVANQTLSYIPKITALREDCYVRLTMGGSMEKEILRPITEKDVYGLGAGWIQKGNHFYYTKLLKTGETMEVFQGIHVPEEWTNETSSSFQIQLTADAVQAPNVTPDFQSDAPWGAIEIEEAKKTDTVEYRSVKQLKDTHTLTYEGNRIFEVPTRDFFSNFRYRMPGDTFEDEVKVKNAAKNNILLEFKSSAKEDALLEKIKLKITVGKNIFYNGNLQAEQLLDWKPLVKLSPKEAQTMRYELSVPEELKNAFSAESDFVVWKFRATEVDPYGKPVQTGDKLPILPLALLCGAAGFGLLMLPLGRKGRRRKKVKR